MPPKQQKRVAQTVSYSDNVRVVGTNYGFDMYTINPHTFRFSSHISKAGKKNRELLGDIRSCVKWAGKSMFALVTKSDPRNVYILSVARNKRSSRRTSEQRKEKYSVKRIGVFPAKSNVRRLLFNRHFLVLLCIDRTVVLFTRNMKSTGLFFTAKNPYGIGCFAGLDGVSHVSALSTRRVRELYDAGLFRTNVECEGYLALPSSQSGHSTSIQTNGKSGVSAPRQTSGSTTSRTTTSQHGVILLFRCVSLNVSNLLLPDKTKERHEAALVYNWSLVSNIRAHKHRIQQVVSNSFAAYRKWLKQAIPNYYNPLLPSRIPKNTESTKVESNMRALASWSPVIATCSVVGTVIRVFSVPSGTLLYSFHRGMRAGQIVSMALDPMSRFLAVSSKISSTIHIFALGAPESWWFPDGNRCQVHKDRSSERGDKGESKGSRHSDEEQHLDFVVTEPLGAESDEERRKEVVVAPSRPRSWSSSLLRGFSAVAKKSAQTVREAGSLVYTSVKRRVDPKKSTRTPAQKGSKKSWLSKIFGSSQRSRVGSTDAEPKTAHPSTQSSRNALQRLKKRAAAALSATSKGLRKRFIMTVLREKQLRNRSVCQVQVRAKGAIESDSVSEDDVEEGGGVPRKAGLAGRFIQQSKSILQKTRDALQNSREFPPHAISLHFVTPWRLCAVTDEGVLLTYELRAVRERTGKPPEKKASCPCRRQVGVQCVLVDERILNSSSKYDAPANSAAGASGWYGTDELSSRPVRIEPRDGKQPLPSTAHSRTTQVRNQGMGSVIDDYVPISGGRGSVGSEDGEDQAAKYDSDAISATIDWSGATNSLVASSHGDDSLDAGSVMLDPDSVIERQLRSVLYFDGSQRPALNSEQEEKLATFKIENADGFVPLPLDGDEEGLGVVEVGGELLEDSGDENMIGEVGRGTPESTVVEAKDVADFFDARTTPTLSVTVANPDVVPADPLGKPEERTKNAPGTPIGDTQASVGAPEVPSKDGVTSVESIDSGSKAASENNGNRGGGAVEFVPAKGTVDESEDQVGVILESSHGSSGGSNVAGLETEVSVVEPNLLPDVAPELDDNAVQGTSVNPESIDEEVRELDASGDSSLAVPPGGESSVETSTSSVSKSVDLNLPEKEMMLPKAASASDQKDDGTPDKKDDGTPNQKDDGITEDQEETSKKTLTELSSTPEGSASVPSDVTASATDTSNLSTQETGSSKSSESPSTVSNELSPTSAPVQTDEAKDSAGSATNTDTNGTATPNTAPPRSNKKKKKRKKRKGRKR